MLSAIAARKARLQHPSTKRSHSHTPGPNSSKKARKATSRSHSEQNNGITTTLSKEETTFSPDYSDDMSITLDQQDTPLTLHERPLEPALRERTKAYSPSRPVMDSSDDESDASEQPLTDLSQLFSYNHPLTNEPQILSTFRPIRGQNLFPLSLEEGTALGLSGPAVALVLSPSTTVSFVGAYRFRVLRGSISLLGTIIQPSRVLHPVFAPRSSPIPVIEALVVHGESSKSLYDIPAQITSSIDESDVIIVLQELRTGIEGIGRVMRTFEGVFHQADLEGVPDIPLGGVHLEPQIVRGMHAFELPPSWEAALSASPILSADEATGLPKSHVLLVKGQKNSGKSTFARTLANRLSFRYRRVAFLECDLGQSEFTPGGMVALSVIERPVFGPPFTHPTVPHQAHYIGAHNPRSSPSHYLRAIQALVEVYRLDLQFATSLVDIEDVQEDDRIADLIPLVINTMGWTKGLGTDLARRIEELTQPSDIFSFEASPSDNAVEPGGPQVHILEPITLPQRFTPSDHRALSLISYFHAVFPDPINPTPPLGQTTASRWNTDLPLCVQPPYEITSSLALDRIVLVGAGAEDVVRTELGRVLSGALVALVSAEPQPEEIEELYVPGSPPPDPASSNCLGLALIRGVSNDGSKLQLLTPVPPERLANARVLVMGELQLPVWGWLDFRSVEGSGGGVDVPFLRWGRSAGAGGERRRVRRNILRRAQM